MNHLFRAICGHISIGLLLFSYSYAGGNYYVGKDDGGIYLQTDNDGGWYIDSRDLRHFNIGESGEYKSGIDHNGQFILTEKKKYYIDTGRKGSLENEIDTFNNKQAQKTKRLETAVAIDGNRVLVPVTIRYAGKTTGANLLLDTGASIVTLHRNIADKLKIRNTQKTTMQLAGGQLIAADIARLDAVSVGPNRKKDIFVSIIEQIDRNADYDGLLGMNFLRNLRYEIDFEKSVIRWYR
jgi:clan AA aspartic protease (TIGR02281 family)